MSKEIKCSKENPCEECQRELIKTLAKYENWEINLKKYIEENQMYTHHVGNSRIHYSITGGHNYHFEKCPSCQAVIKIIKSNSYGDQTEELKEHECKQSNIHRERERERERERANQTIPSPKQYPLHHPSKQWRIINWV